MAQSSSSGGGLLAAATWHQARAAKPLLFPAQQVAPTSQQHVKYLPVLRPCDGLLFGCRNVSKEDIEAFVQADPYVVNGLVPSHTIRPYMVVAGDSK